MSSYDELLSYTKQLERRLAKIERQEQSVSVAGGDHGTLAGLGDDDHSIYLLASTYGGRTTFGTKWTDLTDAGATTLHKHDHGGMDGLGDDDHSIYLLASAATNRATFAANWTDLTDAGATTLHKHDHGGMDGLADDDHTGYARLAGRSGGQTLYGDTAANGNLVLHGTSSGSKATSYINLQPSGGLVGIGTATPGYTLDVTGASALTVRAISTAALGTASGGGVAMATTTTPTAADQRTGIISFGSDNGTDLYTSSGILCFSSEAWTGSARGSYIDFEIVANGATTRTKRMRINQDGNVGIGTSTPTYRLDTVSANALTLRAISSAALGSASGGGLTLEASAHPTAANQRLGLFAWGADDGANNYTPLVLAGFSAEAWTGSAWGAYFDFETTPAGTTSRAKRMRIGADGYIGIGTTTNAPGEKLHVSGGHTLLDNTYYYKVKNSSGTAIRVAGIDGSNDVYIGAIDNAGGSVYIREDGSNRISITAGDVGIGIDAAQAKLHVSGGAALLDNTYYYSAKNAGGSDIKLAGIDSSSNVYLGAIDNAGGKVHIREDGADVITLHAANVGIGTTSPTSTAKLQVEGRVGIKTGVNAISAQLMVYQDNNTAAIAVADLIQDDLSEEFINFRATEGTGNPIDTAALGSYAKKVRVSANGTFYWLALYN